MSTCRNIYKMFKYSIKMIKQALRTKRNIGKACCLEMLPKVPKTSREVLNKFCTKIKNLNRIRLASFTISLISKYYPI